MLVYLDGFPHFIIFSHPCKSEKELSEIVDILGWNSLPE